MHTSHEVPLVRAQGAPHVIVVAKTADQHWSEVNLT